MLGLPSGGCDNSTDIHIRLIELWASCPSFRLCRSSRKTKEQKRSERFTDSGAGIQCGSSNKIRDHRRNMYSDQEHAGDKR
ncbi:hypothetical protein R6Q59_029242 [Mikania micrantha]